jgi:hypothetical protein
MKPDTNTNMTTIIKPISRPVWERIAVKLASRGTVVADGFYQGLDHLGRVWTFNVYTRALFVGDTIILPA